MYYYAQNVLVIIGSCILVISVPLVFLYRILFNLVLSNKLLALNLHLNIFFSKIKEFCVMSL